MTTAPLPGPIAPGPSGPPAGAAPADPPDDDRSGTRIMWGAIAVAAVAVLAACFVIALWIADSDDTPGRGAGNTGDISATASATTEAPTPEPSTESPSPTPSETPSASATPSASKGPSKSPAPTATSVTLDVTDACRQLWGSVKALYAAGDGVLCVLNKSRPVYGVDLEMDKYCWDFFRVNKATVAANNIDWFCGDPVNTVDMNHKCQVSYPNRSETAARPRDLRPNPDNPPAWNWGCNVLDAGDLTHAKLNNYCAGKHADQGLTRAKARNAKDPKSWICIKP